MRFTEKTIAAFLARHTFSGRYLVVVPNCIWTGHECDLLVVTGNLRIIDVEIKISRADLKADAAKDKWFHAWDWKIDGPWPRQGEKRAHRPRQWPMRVWKHYYCMPAEIWKPGLLPNQAMSGVLLIREHPHTHELTIGCERAAKPCRDAEKISADDAIDIARLASLRMWDAYQALDKNAAYIASLQAAA